MPSQKTRCWKERSVFLGVKCPVGLPLWTFSKSSYPWILYNWYILVGLDYELMFSALQREF